MNTRQFESDFWRVYLLVHEFKHAGDVRTPDDKVLPSALVIGDHNKPNMGCAIVGEVHELVKALNEPDTVENRCNSHDEGGDVFVFATCAHMLHGYGIDPLRQLHRANGAGKKSNALDKLAEYASDALDNPTAFPVFFAQLYSVMDHLPPIPISWIESMARTIKKATKNRNGKLGVFSRWDLARGRVMSESEMMADAKPHQEAALRLIRRYVGRALMPADYDRYFWYIFEWQESAKVLAQLEKKLQADVAQQVVAVPTTMPVVYSHIPRQIWPPHTGKR